MLYRMVEAVLNPHHPLTIHIKQTLKEGGCFTPIINGTIPTATIAGIKMVVSLGHHFINIIRAINSKLIGGRHAVLIPTTRWSQMKTPTFSQGEFRNEGSVKFSLV